MILDPITRSERRIRRIISSIHHDIDEGGKAYVRQILRGPRDLYRLEVERPDLAYLRTTILDADALATLLEETPEDQLEAHFHFRNVEH